jgi:DNA-binding response OmpR family regulator
MLQVDEVSSDWSVLLAMGESETVRLMGIVLDGFGYTPIECRDGDEAFESLSANTPFAAVVDMRLADAERICDMVNERGGVCLIILVDEEEVEDAQKTSSRLRAHAWQSIRAEPEKLLATLRDIAIRINGNG